MVARLEACVRELEIRLKLNSRNSSKPPSSDPPGAGRKPARRPGGRKAGGQPGHKGKTRELFRPDQVDNRVAVAVSHCHVCGGKVRGTGEEPLAPRLHQVVEIPPGPAFVTEYRLERARCACCSVVTCAPLPSGVSPTTVGPRLQAALAVLVGRYRLSRREVTEAIVSLFGEKAGVAVGTVSALEERTAAALDGPYREAAEAVRNASSACVDETSFGRGKDKPWLWAACTKDATLYLVADSRSRKARDALLGAFRGTMGTDRFAAYSDIDPRRRQLCWSHLARSFEGLVERGPPAAPVGHAGLRACRDVFAAWDGLRDGRLSFASLRQRLRATKESLYRSLWRFRNCPDSKAASVCCELLAHFDALWTFTRRQDVEPTNNLAERELRPAVLWRKGSFGCRSDRGARFAERMLTVARTLRRQARNVLDFLESAIRAHASGASAPQLLTG